MKYNKAEICKKANELIKKGCTKSAAFKAAWADAKETAIAESNTLAAKAKAFKEMQRQTEELQARMDALKKEIIADMNGREEVVEDIYKIRYVTVTSNRLDTAKFKRENNEIYAMYLKPNESKRFTVTA